MSAPDDDDKLGPTPPPPAARTLRAEYEGGAISRAVLEAIKTQQSPVLVLISGKDVGRRYGLHGSALIGRDPAAAVSLHDDRLVSWHHARIEDRGDGWWLVDLGSTNGTLVNGEKARERELKPNDKIVFGGTVLRFELQSQIERAYDQHLERLLNTDDLSGLLLRRRFDADAAAMIETARVAGGCVGLLVMDLDGVKRINDTHGHLFGAYVIGEAGKLIGRVIGERGIASRFGGDEYVAAFPGLDCGRTAAVGEEILRAINAHPFAREGIALRPGISLGVAAFPEAGADLPTVFHAADEALYRAKQAGKNRVCR
ncbi:MAG TPA: GGDEF domain-containing protein [Polyangiaceae bacterium]|nr:GGDEF domain-containing protein [Polyangiaceae bacterium]